MRHSVRTGLAALAGLVLVVLTGAIPAQAAASSPIGSQQAVARTTTGKALLAKLKVRDEHRRGYQRAKFEHWRDVDDDCQDTRSEVMQDESRTKVTFYSARHCAVRVGRWESWYDGKTWTKATDVEVDHVVALSEAWKSGAWRWTKGKRADYANDLDFAWTLDTITRQVNQDKSGYDPAEWLPEKNRCAYARHWVAVKYRWNLSVDADEKAALAKLLGGDCGRKSLRVPARA